ncbi:MAG: 30S ribosomal protein S12 methylthiotransferase accessory factor YcaO, partial [Enterovibrio sp.]
ISDLTHLGVHCCRIIVPGWSEIYPPEELTLCNNNRGQPLRLAMQELLTTQFSDEACETLFDLLDDSNFDDSLSVSELMGICVPAGSAWKSLTIGELKGLLSLAAGDLQSAQEFIQWCLEYNYATYSQERLQFLRCLQASLQLALDETRDPQEYQEAFAKLYGQAIMDAAWDSIRNEIRFFGLVAQDNCLTAFAPHKMLLDSYQKLQIAKQANANLCGG